MKRPASSFTLATVLLTLLTVSVSCDRFLDITPTGKVIAKTGSEYRSMLTYEYRYFPEDRGLASFRSDEFLFDKSSTSSEDYASFFDIWTWNDTAPQSTTAQFGWRRYYHAIYIANYIIEHRNDISDATESEISQLVGECYMMRAYLHFLLVNLYSPAYTACSPADERGIPLQLEADVDRVPSCSSVEDVYESVLSDISSALDCLNVESWETGLNYRFSIRSAKAILSRVLLYMGRWSEALACAQDVLNEYDTLIDLNVKNAPLPDRYDSPENLLALEQVMTSLYKGAGQPAKDLFSAYRSGDCRKSKYFKQITSSNTTLLKGGSNEFSCSIRTAELYLTAAEAALETGSDSLACDYLCRLLKNRYSASVWATYSMEIRGMSSSDLRSTIYRERRLELAFEGHRWFDLRRWNRPSLTKTYQGVTYTLDENDTRYTIPFPADVIQANPEITRWNK